MYMLVFLFSYKLIHTVSHRWNYNLHVNLFGIRSRLWSITVGTTLLKVLNFPKPNPLHKKFNRGRAANWKHFGSWATWNSGAPCQAWLPWHDCACLTKNLVYKATAITYCNIQYRSHGTEPHERFKCEASTNSRIALAISKTGFESRDVAFQSWEVTFQTWVIITFQLN